MNFNNITPESDELYKDFFEKVNERDFLIINDVSSETTNLITMLNLQANYIATRKLLNEIHKFNDKSTRLSGRMFWLAIVVAVLTVIYTGVSIVQLILSCNPVK